MVGLDVVSLYISEVDRVTMRFEEVAVLERGATVLVALGPDVMGHLAPDPMWRYIRSGATEMCCE